MPPPKLPGFYYDKERNKYFKSGARHESPQGSKYSREALMAAAREEEVEQARQTMMTNRRPAIQRALCSPLLSRLGQESGQPSSPSPDAGSVVGKYWVAGVNAWSAPIGLIAPHDTPTVGRFQCTTLTKHPTTGKVYAALYCNPYSLLWTVDQGDDYDSGSQTWKEERIFYHDGFRIPERSSISLTPHKLMVFTTVDARVVILREGENVRSVSIRDQPPVLSLDLASHRYINYEHFRAGQLKPNSTDLDLAIAADNGVFWTRVSPFGSFPRPSGETRYESDSLCVDWQSQNVFVSGHRDGGIYLHDVRTSGNVCRFKNGTSAAKMRWADENRVVVAGLEHKLCTWDIRSIPDSALELYHQPPRYRPYVSYNYQNEANTNLGMDICPSLGLLAAATDRNEIHLYDFWTGATLKKQTIPFSPVASASTIHSLSFSAVGQNATESELRLAFGSANAVGEICLPGDNSSDVLCDNLERASLG